MWYFKTVICNKFKSREAALSKRTGPSAIRATLDPIQAVSRRLLGSLFIELGHQPALVRLFMKVRVGQATTIINIIILF
jgi:hypothetical protein